MKTALEILNQVEPNGELLDTDQAIAAMELYAETKVKNLQQALVSGQSELLFAFIAEVKKEFADQNWDYLDFIADRVIKANNCT